MYDKHTIYKRNYLLKRLAFAIKQALIAFPERIPEYLTLFVIYVLLSYTVFYSDILPILSILTIIALSCVTLILYGHFLQSTIWADKLFKAGMNNKKGEAPIFIKKTHKSGLCYDYYFYSDGITEQDWKDRINDVENALNLSIQEIRQGKNKRSVIVSAVAGDYHTPDIMPWNDNMISDKSYELVFGDSYGEPVVWSLIKVPHGLIGGSSGSGKTQMLKLLLYQCAKKNHKVYISDFKGGIDYNSPFFRKNTEIITSYDKFDKLLKIIVDEEMPKRTKLLLDFEVKNINEYNKLNPADKVPYIILAVDEVAEVLDKTGMTKEKKAKIAEWEANLSKIARLARALNISLILATQRPDANVLPGQIKNNLDFRLCGRADDVLSQIILDNTSAADLIPKDGMGMFVNQDGLVIKGYYYVDKS